MTEIVRWRGAASTVTVVAAALATATLPWTNGALSATEASYTDEAWAKADVATGVWSTSGWAQGVALGNLTANSASIIGAVAERDQDHPGQDTDTAGASWGAGVLGALGVYSLDASGSSCAAYTVGQPPGLNCLHTGYEADATATVSTFRVRHGSTILNVQDWVRIQGGGSLGASVRCDHSGDTAFQPTGTLEIKNGNNANSLAPYNLGTIASGTVGSPGVTTINHSWGGGPFGADHAQGSLTKIVDSANGITEVRLTLQTKVTLGGIGLVTVDHSAVLLRASCEMEGSPAPAPLMASGSAAAPESRMSASRMSASLATVGEDLAEEPATEKHAAEESAVEEPASAEPPPAPADLQPQPVAVGTPFAVTALDGTDLGIATVRRVLLDPDCPAAPDGRHVAVEVSLTTSSETGDGRISRITAGTFAELAPDGDLDRFTRDVDGCAGTEPQLARKTSPSRTYTGWIVLDAASAASTLVFAPEGTRGWTFTLPAEPVAPTTPAPPAPAPAPSEVPEATPTPPPTPSPTRSPPSARCCTTCPASPASSSACPTRAS